MAGTPRAAFVDAGAAATDSASPDVVGAVASPVVAASVAMAALVAGGTSTKASAAVVPAVGGGTSTGAPAAVEGTVAPDAAGVVGSCGGPGVMMKPGPAAAGLAPTALPKAPT